MPSLTAVELVEDSEPEREAARTQAQEERRKRRVMSKSPSSQVVFMLSSSPVPVPLPRLVEPLADAALADPLAASGVHSPVARSQALEPVGRRSSSPIVIESNVRPPGPVLRDKSSNETIDISSSFPSSPTQPALASAVPSSPVVKAAALHEVIVLSDSEESEVNIRQQLAQFRYGSLVMSRTSSSSSEGSRLGALPLKPASRMPSPLEPIEPIADSVTVSEAHPVATSAAKPKPKPRAADNPLSAAFSDVQLAKLGCCVACELKWTARKTVVEKVKHVSACARKRGLNEGTLLALIGQELERAPAAAVPAQKAKGKAKQIEDEVPAAPRTFLTEVMTKEAETRKRGRRPPVQSTVLNPADNRQDIVGRARALIGNDPATTANERPLPRPAFTMSGARIAEEKAKADRLEADRLRAERLKAMSAVPEEPPLTQVFGRSALAGPSRLTSLMGPPRRTLFLDDTPAADDEPASPPMRPARSALSDEPPLTQPFAASSLAMAISTPTALNDDAQAAKQKRLQAIAAALAEQTGQITPSPTRVSDISSRSSREALPIAGPSTLSPRVQSRSPSPRPDDDWAARSPHLVGDVAYPPEPPETYARAEPNDYDWSYDNAYLHWDPPAQPSSRRNFSTSTSSSSSKRRRRSRSRSRSRPPPADDPTLSPPPPPRKPRSRNKEPPNPYKEAEDAAAAEAEADEPPAKKPKTKRKTRKAKDADEFEASLDDLESKMLELILADEALHLRILRYEPIDFAVFMQMAKDAGFPERGLRLVLKPFLDKQAVQFYGAEGTIGRVRTKRR